MMATILIVEDEPFTVELLTRALEQAGHKVSSAANGVDGVAKVKKARPDLVIMDMSMPKMNGWEATRLLKGDAATRDIPVLALTSAVTAEDRDEAYTAGCDAYVTKPVHMARLLERVEELTGA
jgi:two-component system cell cycle response regulator DivK